VASYLEYDLHLGVGCANANFRPGLNFINTVRGVQRCKHMLPRHFPALIPSDVWWPYIRMKDEHSRGCMCQRVYVQVLTYVRKYRCAKMWPCIVTLTGDAVKMQEMTTLQKKNKALLIVNNTYKETSKYQIIYYYPKP